MTASSTKQPNEAPVVAVGASADASGKLTSFAPVEFKRGEWKAFETYASDFLTDTSALPGATVGVYARVRAAFWAYGNGWSLQADALTWVTYAGAEDVHALDHALQLLEPRGLLVVRDAAGTLTIADPSMHRELGRKERERSRWKERQSKRNSTRSSVRSSHENSEEGKRKKEEEKNGESDTSRSDAVLEVLAHYRSLHPRAIPNPRPASKEWRLVVARLDDGFTIAELKSAIDGNHRSTFHAGQNKDGAKYQRLANSLGTADLVTQFFESSQAPVAPSSASPGSEYLDVSKLPVSRLPDPPGR